MSDHEHDPERELEQAFAEILATRTAIFDQAAAQLAEWAPVVAQGVASYRTALLVQDVPEDEALSLVASAQSDVIGILFQAVTDEPPRSHGLSGPEADPDGS